MSTIYTQMPLYEDPIYQYTLSLEEQERIIKFYWNSRDAAWYMDVRNIDGTAVHLGVKMVADFPILVDVVSEHLVGWFFLSSENERQSKRLTEDSSVMPQFFTLYHVYEKED